MLRSGAPQPTLWASVEDASPFNVKGDDLKQEFLTSLSQASADQAFSQCEQRLFFDSMARGQPYVKLAALTQNYWLSLVLLETVGSLDLQRRFTALTPVADVKSRRAIASDLAVQYLMSAQATDAPLGGPEAFFADPMMALLHYYEPQATETYFLLEALQNAAGINEALTRSSLFYRLTPAVSLNEATLRAHTLAPIATVNAQGFSASLGPPRTGGAIRPVLPSGTLPRMVHEGFRPPGLKSDPTARDDPETSGGCFPMPATMTVTESLSGIDLEDRDTGRSGGTLNAHKHLIYDSNAYIQSERLRLHQTLASITTTEGVLEEADGNNVKIDFHPAVYMGEGEGAIPQTANVAWRIPLLQVLLQTTLNWQIMQNIEERLHTMGHSSDRFVLLAAHAHDSVQRMLSTEDGKARKNRLLNLYLDPEEMSTHVPTLAEELQYYLLLLFQTELDGLRLNRVAGGEHSPRLLDISASLTEAIHQAGGLTADLITRTTQLFWQHSAPDGYSETVKTKRVRQFVARVLREHYNHLAPPRKRHRGRREGPRLDLVKDVGIGTDVMAEYHTEAITRVIRQIIHVPRDTDPDHYVREFMKGEGAVTLEKYVARGMTERVRRVYDGTIDTYRKDNLFYATMMVEEISYVMLTRPSERDRILSQAPPGSSLGDVYSELVKQLDTTLFVSGPIFSATPRDEINAMYPKKLAIRAFLALTRTPREFFEFPLGSQYSAYRPTITWEKPIDLSDTIRMLRRDLPLIGARYYARNKYLYQTPTTSRSITLSNAGTDQRPVYAEPDRGLPPGSSRIETGGHSTQGFSSAWLKREVIGAQTQYMSRMATLVDLNSKNPHNIRDLEWEEATERPIEFHLRYEMPREATRAQVTWTVNGRPASPVKAILLTPQDDIRSRTTSMSLKVPSSHSLLSDTEAAEAQVMYFSKRRPEITVACVVEFFWSPGMPTGSRASSTVRVHIVTPVRQRLGRQEADLHRVNVSSGEEQRRYEVVYDTLRDIESDPKPRSARQKEIDAAYLRQIYHRSWMHDPNQKIPRPPNWEDTPTSTRGGALAPDMGVMFAQVKSLV